jgi:hypothetical protein
LPLWRLLRLLARVAPSEAEVVQSEIKVQIRGPAASVALLLLVLLVLRRGGR